MQKAIEFKCKGYTLRGMEHVPDRATDKIPAVVLYHGFAATSRRVRACQKLQWFGTYHSWHRGQSGSRKHRD
jgi:cephalosporin-C deacetylase-like acetyl esterase